MKNTPLLQSPRIKAGTFSRYSFTWIYPLFTKGKQKELELEDLYEALPEDRSEKLSEQLDAAWEEEINRCRKINDDESLKKTDWKPKKPRLVFALAKIYFWKWALLGIFAFFIEECIIKICQPLFLGLLLRQLQGDFSKVHGYLFAFGLTFTSVYYTACHHPAFFEILHMNMQIRIACSSLIYKKALKLNQTSLSEITIGKLVNILSNDVSRLDQSLNFLHYLWIGPTQLAISIVILWHYFGPPCLAGVAFLLLFTPFQSLMGRAFAKLRMTGAIRTDSRIRLMNDILNGIRLIKMYTWELPFSKLVKETRQNEVKIIQKTTVLRSLNQSLYFVSSKVILFLTLLTYVLTGNFLTAEKVFVASALYSNVRLIMTIFFPMGISVLAETIVSIRRIENFLDIDCSDTTETMKIQQNHTHELSDNKIRLTLANVCAQWTEEHTLKNITFHVQSPQFTAIIGPVGSGKSSLLQIILEELPITSGTIDFNGKIAYASQESWIFSGSIRENILFGNDYDSIWYDEVIEACSLKKDFESMRYSDKTYVGDKGIALSGGQKSRIGLARAVYSKKDIYLLDDPLSAVDAQVARHLFQKCIRGILKDKIVLLVTHQLQFLQNADEILVMNSGSVEAQGNYQEIFAKNSAVLQKITSSGSVETLHDNDRRKSSLVKEMKPDVIRKMSVISDQLDEKDLTEESKLVGSVGARTYWEYFRNGCSRYSIVLLVILNLLSQLLYSGADFWLKAWTKGEEMETVLSDNDNRTFVYDQNDTIYVNDINDGKFSRGENVGIYTTIIILLFFVSLMRAIGFFRMAMQSSVNLHAKLFHGVLYAPMKFFELNPIGRILNRFAKDISIIDDILSLTLYDTIEVGLQVIGVLIIVCIVNPIFLIPSFFLGVMFFVIRNFYLKTARSLKRLEGIARSPVYSHLSTTLQGLTTIRAFKAEGKLINEFHRCLDVHSATWYLFLATTRWLGVVVDGISIIFITLVIFALLIFAEENDGAAVGLAISSCLTLTSWFQWGVRQSAEAENQMVSVERVLEYSKLEPEESLNDNEILKHCPGKQWPSSGNIVVKNLCLKYSSEDENFVLKNVSFTVNAKEKIGIIGRTGSGKSSLVAAIFRTTKPLGSIEIDGVDCLKLSLNDLRSKISILPQDPVLFIGTLRYNLDPFGKYSDEQLINSLKDVHLWEAIKELSSGLDTPVAEGGGNFSVGQRQLICLARSILLDNKILILDEATANVDPETDHLIQQTIRRKFSHCTVLTIAHRLNTIMDSDKIIVIHQGTIQEYDEPSTLLKNPNSFLLKMVQQTGVRSAEQLISIAKNKQKQP